jgi:transposase
LGAISNLARRRRIPGTAYLGPGGGGQSDREIERNMHTSAATIARWRTRFEQDRLPGLESRHKGSQPRIATATVQARVVRRVQQKPNDGSTHWSCRKLSRDLGVSKSTVQTHLSQARLKPHRLERCLASDDPDFESNARTSKPSSGRLNRSR